MGNPPTLPNRSNLQRVPTARPISWPATIPQFLALALTVSAGWIATHTLVAASSGAAVYLVYSLGSRAVIPRAHRRGIRLTWAARHSEAVRAYEESYEFFTRHSWLDRFRCVTMMTPSAMSYREMALLNIAFAYSQIGNGERTKEYYQRTLDEFPNNGLANAALKMIESLASPRIEAGTPA